MAKALRSESELVTSSGDHQSISSDAPHVVGTRLFHTILDQFPSLQTKLGDKKLERAGRMTDKFESIISRDDHKIIQERILL